MVLVLAVSLQVIREEQAGMIVIVAEMQRFTQLLPS
jgi:hypothetical protein